MECKVPYQCPEPLNNYLHYFLAYEISGSINNFCSKHTWIKFSLKKSPELSGLRCGEGGIRTLDTVLRPYDGLANR